MTARVIHESYEGGTLTVDVDTSDDGGQYVSVTAFDPLDGETILWFTRDEAMDLVEAVIDKIDVLGPADQPTPDTRPSVSPVAEGRGAGPSDLLIAGPGCTTETAPVGAGAAPTAEDASGSPLSAGGPSRTQATGPSTPTAGPGRPTCDDCAPFLCICGAVPGDELFVNELVVTEAEPPHVVDPPGCPTSAMVPSGGPMLASAAAGLLANNPAVCEHGYRFENGLCPLASCGASAFVEPATSLLSGLSIAEITAARLAADPASADVPFEAGGALHVVERCGCNDCEDAFAKIAPGTPVGGEVR